MFKTESDRERMVQAANFKIETENGLAQIYRKFDTLIPCEANNSQIIRACNRYCEREVAPTLGIFQQVLEDNPEFWKGLATRSTEKTRELLVDDICDLLAAKGKGHDAWSLNQERIRLKTFTIPALRARLADLQTKARMAGQSLTTLKAYVADAHRDQRPFPGFPSLPKSVWDGTKTVTVNAAFFRGLDAYELRRYCRLYSTEQINQRMAEG